MLYFTYVCLEYKIDDPRCISYHSALFQLFNKLGRDSKANLRKHIFHLFFKCIPFAVELIDFLFQFVVLL